MEPITSASLYQGVTIALPCKHQKSKAIQKPFFDILGAQVDEIFFDTDLLGTFSGEVERKGNALEAAKAKCLLALSNPSVSYSIASEGSFGPHPANPFFLCGQEILYFIDKKRQFHLFESAISKNTNFQGKEISSLDELERFAEKALFPSHGLIIRPSKLSKTNIIKGITDKKELIHAFETTLSLSQNATLWVETDMRAHYNPTRMNAIYELAVVLAKRLKTLCPQCKTPGFGKVAIQRGLECRVCASETDEIKATIFGCTLCQYKEIEKVAQHDLLADPRWCPQCNP